MYPQFCKYIYNTMKGGKWGIQRCLKDSLSSPFYRPFSRWTWISRCSLKQRMMEVAVTTGLVVQSSGQIITTNKPTSSFLQAGCPSCHPTNSIKALKGKITHSMDLLTPNSPGVFPTCLWPLIAPGYHGEVCHASHQPSDASTPVPGWLKPLSFSVTTLSIGSSA